MSLAKQQIKDLFTNHQEIMEKGLWFSGIEGEGEFKQWYVNGQLEVHSFYKNGKLDGEHKSWDKNGQLVAHSIYKDDRVVKNYLKLT